MNYQYRAFGVPGLGLKAGLGDDLVVAPYATVLAGLVRPDLVAKNLRALAQRGSGWPVRLLRGHRLHARARAARAPRRRGQGLLCPSPGHEPGRARQHPESGPDAAALPSPSAHQGSGAAPGGTSAHALAAGRHSRAVDAAGSTGGAPARCGGTRRAAARPDRCGCTCSVMASSLRWSPPPAPAWSAGRGWTSIASERTRCWMPAASTSTSRTIPRTGPGRRATCPRAASRTSTTCPSPSIAWSSIVAMATCRR